MSRLTYHCKDEDGWSHRGLTFIRFDGEPSGYYERSFGVPSGCWGAYRLRLRGPLVRPEMGKLSTDYHAADEVRRALDGRVAEIEAAETYEVCDNCGLPLVLVRSREGRFCTSECADAYELS